MSGALRTGFTGYYGMDNFGDDLFGAICSNAARRYWNADPLLIGPPIAGVDARFTVRGSTSSSHYGGLGLRGKSARLLSFTRGLAGSDVLVMGGGSVISARRSFRAPLMLLGRRCRNLKLAAVGVSIAPFNDAEGERAIGEQLRHFDYISVRDLRSHELASQLGVGCNLHRGRDLAGMLPLLDVRAHTVSRPRPAPLRLGIAPCNYSDTGEYPAPARARWEAALVGAVSRLAAGQELQVEVFSLNEHPHLGDGAIAADLHQKLLANGVDSTHWRYTGRGPLDAVRAIGRCDAMISARLHGAIVAYMQGIPFAIIDYHRKCRDFASDIGLLGPRLVGADACDQEAMDQVLRSLQDTMQRPALSHEVYADQASDIFKCAPWSTSGRAA